MLALRSIARPRPNGLFLSALRDFADVYVTQVVLKQHYVFYLYLS